MKLALSKVRELSDFATPPRIIVVAEQSCTAEAIHLADLLDGVGAEAEVRFGEDATDFTNTFHPAPDAVIVASRRGYRIARHHAILDTVPALETARSRR